MSILTHSCVLPATPAQKGVRLLSAAALLLCAGTSWAAVINVPADQPTIQLAIDAAVNGDEVVVAPGTYFERINFLGKAITVRSTGGAAVTTIDGTGLPVPVVSLITSETSASILDGFTITGGAGGRGAGMRIGSGTTISASPIIRNVVFLNNSADSATSTFRRGGAVSIVGPSTAGSESRPRFENVTFSGNTSGSTARTSARGGAVDVNPGFPTFVGCTFTNNQALGSISATVNGGALHIEAGGANIENCTFTGNRSQGNSSAGTGGAIQSNGVLTITGTTFDANTSTGDGATIAQNNGSTTITGGAITNAAGGGGSAFRSLAGPATFTGVNFSGNTGTTNIIVQMNNPAAGTTGPFTFNNCTFTTGTGQTAVRMAAANAEITFNGGSFNNATGNGNAIFASDATSTLRINGTSFQGYGTATTAAGTGNVTGATYTGNGVGARFGSALNPAAQHTLTNATFLRQNTGVTLAGGTLTVSGTAIDGSGAAGTQIVGLSASGGTLVSNGLNVRSTNRGAIVLSSADATITGGQLVANTGFGSTGVLSTSGGTVTVNGTIISGVPSGAAFSASDTVLTLSGVTFSGNNGIATALISATAEQVNLTGCTFVGNSSVSDTLALSLDPSLSPLISGNTFELNSSSSCVASSDGTPKLVRNRFLRNTNSSGSGTINLSGGSAVLDGNLLLGNSTGPGSIINLDGPTSAPVLVNNVLARNTGTGAAIYVFDGNATLANNTVALNAGPGVQIDSAGTVTVSNSILRDNVGGDLINNAGIVTASFNNVLGGWTGAGTGNIDSAQAFSDPDGTDNTLNTADDNYALATGSIGINAGSTALVPAGITLDAADAARVVGASVDQGAYEFVQTVVGCGPSDVAGPGQVIGADGQLTADDIIVFIGWFFAADARADVAGAGQTVGADGQFTADDIILFVNRFFAGC
jgi:hypothetical protein